MAERSPYQDAREAAIAGRRGGICDRFLVGLVAAHAGSRRRGVGGRSSIHRQVAGKLGAERSAPPPSLASPASSLFAGAGNILDAERARNQILFHEGFSAARTFDVRSDPQLNVTDDALIDDTTVWQRLAEYRTRDRVQVLTLWKSGASTVSLQAGKKGSPTLQWTSRLMNRGAATRGLLDRLFPVSAFGESSGSRASRSTPQPTGESSDLTRRSAPGTGLLHRPSAGPAARQHEYLAGQIRLQAATASRTRAAGRAEKARA